MFKNNAFSNISASRLGIMILTAGILLVTAACGGTAANSPDTAPANAGNTTAVQPPADVPTQSPTETPAPIPTDTPTPLPAVTVPDSGICSLLTTAEVDAVLGEPVTSINPSSKTIDFIGSTYVINYCTYLGSGSRKVVIDIWDPATKGAYEFKRDLDKQLWKNFADEPGLGENAYSYVSGNDLDFTVYKDTPVYIDVLSHISGDPSSSKVSLLKLTQSVLVNAQTQSPTGMPTALPTVEASIPDICSLVTQADVEAVMPVFGSSSNPSKPDDISHIPYFSCTYHDYKPANPLGNDTVDIDLWDAGSVQVTGEIFKKHLDQKRNTGATLTQVTGLGDDAYWIVEDGLVSYIVSKDTHVFRVVYSGSDAKTKQAPLLKLAEAVLATQ